jgi:ATP-dependent Lhr-like helicase
MPEHPSLAPFHPLVRRWFLSRFASPTGVQALVWPVIAAGEHVLATAPTGSGKTLAAFLWAINQLATGAWGGDGVRLIYISPLRALNNDIRRNLLEPLRQLRDLFSSERQPLPDINVVVRSGDTEPAERRRMLSHPPQILITTPESLNLLLSSASGRRIMDEVQSLILDEIHAVAADKRGVYLMTAVERLTLLAGEVQRIALSATVEPLAGVAALVGGFGLEGGRYVPRPVRTVRAADTRRVEIDVQPMPRGLGPQDTTWSAMAEQLRRRIEPDSSTLVFVNNRFLSERLCHLINQQAGAALAWSHHGSLAREVRALVEQRLKSGELSAIVATGSLELGIDIGSVERVLLVQAPRTLNSAIQRVGRSGHSVGGTSRATLYPAHHGDLLDAAVLAPLVKRQVPQAVRLVTAPLDVLAQVIVAMCGVESWQPDELFAFVRTCHSYHDLRRAAFDSVVQMLMGRYADARIQSLRPRLGINDRGELAALPGAMGLVYTSGGVIPDRGYFSICVGGTRAALGQLDEEFVWERKEGDIFRIGMQNWRIVRVGHNDVEVAPAGASAAMAPFWRGEREDRDHALCCLIGEFLESADGRLRDPAFRQTLIDEHLMDPDAADQLIGYLHRQRAATGTPLPHRHHIVIEHVTRPGSLHTGQGDRAADTSQIIIHAPFGGTVLRPWATAISAAFDQRYGGAIEVYATDSALSLQIPGELSGRELLDLVSPADLDRLLRRKLETTGYFGARFRENAARALLLPRQVRRRMPLWLNRLRAKRLYQQVRRYPDFPIIAETWRQCLEDHFECGALRQLLGEIASGQIRVSEVKTDAASPMAAGLVWRSTNQYMYESDRSYDSAPSSLSEQALRQVLHDAALRPKIPGRIVVDLLTRLHRTGPLYAPATADELVDAVNERLAVPAGQWTALAAAAAGAVAEAADRLVGLLLPQATVRLLVAAERVPRLLRSLRAEVGLCDVRRADGREMPAAALAELDRAARSWHPPEGDLDEADLLADTVADIAAFQGPLAPATLQAWLGGPPARLEAAVGQLVEDGRLVCDQITDTAEGPEYCHVENLERLLRMLRAAQRPALAARPSADLPLLMATVQGLVSRGNSIEDLQDRLEKLMGLPVPAEMWETAILPARLQPYLTSWLDSLVQSSDLAWLGTGKEMVALCLRGDMELLARHGHTAGDLLPSPEGRYDFFALQKHTALTSAELARRLWEEAWAGRITNDSFATLRKGIENRFEPSELPPAAPGRARAAGSRRSLAAWRSTRPVLGNWHAVGGPVSEPDRLEQIEADKDRARLVLGRYGVIWRDLLAREHPSMRWGRLLPALRLMELAGEVLAGQFFAGLAGLQFASPEAVRLLEAALDESAIYWMSAADPASLCGVGAEGLEHFPPRQASTLLVLHGRLLAMVARRSGRQLDLHVSPDDERIAKYLVALREQLERQFQPQHRITVETINDQPSLRSPYRPALERFGFVSDYDALVLYRKY